MTTRVEFFEWLSTCPVVQEFKHDDYGISVVSFEYEEEEEDEGENLK